MSLDTKTTKEKRSAAPRLKLVIRRLPWAYTVEQLQSVLSADAVLGTQGEGRKIGAPEILQLEKGKAANKYKGLGSVPGWATVLAKSIEQREALVRAFDNKALDPQNPNNLTYVEYCPLQQVSYVEAPRPEIVDESAGLIYEDPEFLQFSKQVEEDQHRTLEPKMGALQSWLAEQQQKEEKLSREGGATDLVQCLIGKWYQGKKLPWEIRAGEKEQESKPGSFLISGKKAGKSKAVSKRESRRERQKGKKAGRSGRRDDTAVVISHDKKILMEMEQKQKRKDEHKKRQKEKDKEKKEKERKKDQKRKQREDDKKKKKERQQRDDRKKDLIKKTNRDLPFLPTTSSSSSSPPSATADYSSSPPGGGGGGGGGSSKFSVSKATGSGGGSGGSSSLPKPRSSSHADPAASVPPKPGPGPAPPAKVRIMKRPPVGTVIDVMSKKE